MFAPLLLAFTLALQTGAATAPPPDPASPPTPAVSEKTPSGPDTNGTYRIGRGVSMPEVIHKAEPVYPKSLGKLKDRDTPVVGIIIDPQGMPTNVHLVHSISDSTDPKQRAIADAVDQAIIDAVKQYRFKPAMLQGKPVPVELKIAETNIN